MKLCWGLITKPNALWVQCLRARYECGDDYVPRVEKKKYNSLTWRAITEVWERFLQGVGKKIILPLHSTHDHHHNHILPLDIAPIRHLVWLSIPNTTS